MLKSALSIADSLKTNASESALTHVCSFPLMSFKPLILSVMAVDKPFAIFTNKAQHVVKYNALMQARCSPYLP